MISAVDSSVILDVLAADAVLGERSEAVLRQASQEGQLIVCETVTAEVFPVLRNAEAFEEFSADWGLLFVPSSRKSAILAGRRWYDVATSRAGGREGIYGGAWSGPVFVITHHPPAASDDAAITFLSGGIRNAVAATLAAAEGKNIVILGANTARQCLAAGLVDEILIHMVPVLLGGSIRLYGSPGAGRVNLERIGVGQSGQVTDLRFRVVK